MKYANKLGAHFTLVLGDNELQTGKAALKNMDTGEAREVDLQTGVLSALYDEGIAQTIHNITQDIEHLAVQNTIPDMEHLMKEEK